MDNPDQYLTGLAPDSKGEGWASQGDAIDTFNVYYLGGNSGCINKEIAG